MRAAAPTANKVPIRMLIPSRNMRLFYPNLSAFRLNSNVAPGSRSEPGSDAGKERKVTQLLACGGLQAPSPTERATVFDTDIGANERGELIAQPDAKVARRQPRAGSFGGNVLQGEVQFRSRLQYQPLGDAHIMLGLDASREISPVREEGGRLDLYPIGSETLNPEDQVATILARPDVVSDTRLKVEPGTYGVAP